LLSVSLKSHCSEPLTIPSQQNSFHITVKVVLSHKNSFQEYLLIAVAFNVYIHGSKLFLLISVYLENSFLSKNTFEISTFLSFLILIEGFAVFNISSLELYTLQDNVSYVHCFVHHLLDLGSL